jgi:RNA recognition motif-containing protein
MINSTSEPTVHVSGLPWEVNEEGLRNFFNGYNPNSVKILK